MKYFSFSVIRPLTFLSAGQFVHEAGWIHSERIIDSFEIIVVSEGTLYIQQAEEEFTLQEGNVLLLQPGVMHRGWKPCDGRIRFFWFHFLPGPYNILNEDEAAESMWRTALHEDMQHEELCILPVFSPSLQTPRLEIMLHQLIHISRATPSINTLKKYTLTSILIQLYQNHLDSLDENYQPGSRERIFSEILEWIRLHCTEKLYIGDVALRFHYNEDYFSKMFRSKTGIHFIDYVNRLRIEKAKNLLYSTTLSIKEIGFQVGFSDDKYFMKVFKKSEGLSPSQYRHAFYLLHQNQH